MNENKINCLNVSPLVFDKFRVEVEDIPGGVRVVLNGEIDIRDPGAFLDPFFDSIHTRVMDRHMKTVEINFCNLTFLNSSGIKPFARWVLNVNKLEKEKQYILKIIYARFITWQKISLKTMSYLAPSVVKVEEWQPATPPFNPG